MASCDLRAIELVDPAAGGQEGLEQRDLAVLVEVGARVGDRLGEVLAEPGEVLLVAAPGRGDDDAVLAREPVEERAARRGAVEDRDRPLDRLQPFGQLDVGDVRARAG